MRRDKTRLDETGWVAMNRVELGSEERREKTEEIRDKRAPKSPVTWIALGYVCFFSSSFQSSSDTGSRDSPGHPAGSDISPKATSQQK